jgi:hypothetical protein
VSGAAPSAPASPTQEGGSLWRWLHVTPARAAIAATVLVAVGITMTRTRTGPDEIGQAARSGALAPQVAVARDSALLQTDAVAERDPLLDSAIKRNLAVAQPPRALDAVRSPSVPVPEAGAPAIGLAGVDTTAGTRVAIARREVEAQREQRADMADKARVGAAAEAAAPPAVASRVLGKAAGDEAANATSGYSGAIVSQRSASNVARQCFLIESSAAGATWGGQAFPVIVSTDSSARLGQAPVQVLDAAGRPTSIRAQFERASGDSLVLRLRRLGYTGSIALGPDVGGRAGLAFSEPVSTQLEAVVVTSAGAQERDARTGATAARKAAGASAPGAARADAPAPPPTAPPTPKSAGNRVSMRAVGCPARSE